MTDNGDKKYSTISIPKPLFDKIKGRIDGTGFNSVSSYVTYVLRQVISQDEPKDEGDVFSKEDEEKIKERLRSLGYLD